ncbi:hypothetical protein J2Z50_003448 [Ensifer mexicanus]|uniref:Uncharacterized protein n=1 Tax=Sinorhizobium mexicanum TaxID=375549 RepID=A0A859QD68_9HYPH|nr:hypothetical protein [Sinorhizobium mexicanum]QLL62993.1 hypothetical protein FKV68_16875 [Sinorhizobium mexicanum]
MRFGLWSALQTHLQGGDGATLAVVPEIGNHAQPSLHQLSCRVLLPPWTKIFNLGATNACFLKSQPI